MIIGPGRWGSALSQSFQDNGFSCTNLDENSTAKEWKAAFLAPSFVLIATPFSQVATSLKRVTRFENSIGIINASKGIDHRTLKTFSQIASIITNKPTATLAGPSFAKELAEKKPTACVLASKNKMFCEHLASRLSNEYLRLYPHTDPVGVELCGALKNIMAIACGISDGMDLGANARAALLTRGLTEITKVVKIYRASPSSVFGLAGVGDLWMTATGSLSRNRHFGLLIAKGMNAKQALAEINQPVEGLYTIKQVEKIRKQKKIDLPICQEVYRVCNLKKDPRSAIKQLMTRAVKFEESSTWQLR